jgi:hypothetical protein
MSQLATSVYGDSLIPMAVSLLFATALTDRTTL